MLSPRAWPAQRPPRTGDAWPVNDNCRWETNDAGRFGGGNWPEGGTASDGAALGTFDARSVWKTHDGALIYLTYTGRSRVPADVGAMFRDPAQPFVAHDRYYIRIEQTDGSMAWSSPVWVQVK